MATDIAEVLARAKLREKTVSLCLAGDLQAEVERLETELSQLAQWRPDSMAEADPRVDLAERIEAARERMRDSEVEFVFRALGAQAWSDLTASHPGRTDTEAFNPESLAPALVAASAIDPVMTPQQVADLWEVLSHGQREELVAAAWSVNSEATSVPFSLPASAILASRTAGR